MCVCVLCVCVLCVCVLCVCECVKEGCMLVLQDCKVIVWSKDWSVGGKWNSVVGLY